MEQCHYCGGGNTDTSVNAAHSFYSAKVPKGEDKREISNLVAEQTSKELEQTLDCTAMITKKTNRSCIIKVINNQHIPSNEELEIRIKPSLIKNKIMVDINVGFSKLTALTGTLYQNMKEYFQSMGFGGKTVLVYRQQ